MSTSKLCCGPRKVAAGKGRRGDETQKVVNNIRHREGGVKGKGETGTESYGHYILRHGLLIYLLVLY
jgi:hypothetical protein